MKFSILAVIFAALVASSCGRAGALESNAVDVPAANPNRVEALPIFPGIYNVDQYLPLLEGKKVAIVANQASIVDTLHLADMLIKEGVNVVKAFCPEHGFRGTADAGQKVDSGKDEKTGLDVVSLYGNNKKPTAEQLKNIDMVVFDLQDVGVRFYTYLSTLHYVMEACAESDIPVVVLDRPNPNASYVDGPVLDTANYRSFVGMHPVPIVYGMTIGEYAQMINGEGWLKGGIECDLTVVPCMNYTHYRKYKLPIKPSPNLPNARSIELYPTLCIFEATCISVGRGTDMQFQVLGHPLYKDVIDSAFVFTPKPNAGASNPLLNGKECYGFNLSSDDAIFYWQRDKFNVSVIIKMFELFPDKPNFFNKNNMLEKLVGYKAFRKQIENGVSEVEIRSSWESELENFKKIRSKYLIYS